MKMEYIQNITFDEINVGDTASLEHVLTKEDIALFANLSGDASSGHFNQGVMRGNPLHQVVAHGMWGATFLSTILETKLPGPGTVYLNQTLNFAHPVALGDKITTRIKVKSKNIENKQIEFDCKVVNQLGNVVLSGVATVVAPIKRIFCEKAELPKLVFKDSESGLYSLLKGTSKNLAPLITAVVHPVDELSIVGAVKAAEDNIIKPILIGPRQKIIDAADKAKVDISQFEIVATEHSHEAAEVAVQLAKTGKVEALMKGKLHTDELMHAVVNKVTGIRTERRMSHVFAMEVENYPKPLFLTDAAINLFPDLPVKIDIVQNAIDLFRGMGFGIPKVAIVSAVETVNPQIPSTIDAATISKMADRGQIIGGIVDGPLAFDNAISKESAKVKGIVSKVAGDADIIVVPDIEAGNLLYKQMTYLSGMEAAGIVMGARVPIILTSRGSDEISRKASCMMALIYARNKGNIEL